MKCKRSTLNVLVSNFDSGVRHMNGSEKKVPAGILGILLGTLASTNSIWDLHKRRSSNLSLA